MKYEYIKRNLEETILRHIDSPEIIAIVGTRQCGKTTMINEILKNLKGVTSVSFDDQTALNLFEKSVDDFISVYVKGNKYLFIDEFHYAENGGKILKYIFDTQKIKIIISGSSTTDLTIKAVKYLVGRIMVFNLYPFDFQEFLLARDKNYLKLYKEQELQVNFEKNALLKISKTAHQKLSKYYEEYLLFGGYPRVVLEDNFESKKEILRNIYNTYFLREVRDILGLIDDYKLTNLMKGLALQIGNLLEYNELSRISNYSYPSLKKYLNFLEKTFVCDFVKPFYKNKRVEIVKNPKVYFFDTGLRNIIANDFRKLDDRADSGALLENGLAMQFIKHGIQFNFWRDKKKHELDFILQLGASRIIALESKSYLKDVNLPVVRIFKKLYPEIDIYFSYTNVAKKLEEIGHAYPVYLY